MSNNSEPFGDLDGVLEDSDDGDEPAEVTDSDTETDGTEERSKTTGDSADSPEVESETKGNASDTAEPADTAGDTDTMQVGTAPPDPDVVANLATTPTPGGMGQTEAYPYVFRRASWNDERGGNLKFCLQEETQEMEETAKEEIQENLFPNTDLYVSDIREAAYIVGLRNLGDVVDVLAEWGFQEQEKLNE